MPCPNRYTSTAALWPLRIILALETVTISNFQQGERLSLAASPNRPPKFPAFRQIPASPFPSILRFSSSCMVYTMDFVWNFRNWNSLDRFLFFFFRVKKRLEENKEFKEVFWESILSFCLYDLYGLLSIFVTWRRRGMFGEIFDFIDCTEVFFFFLYWKSSLDFYRNGKYRKI